ncbi:MAG: DUF4157 domain-containing protein [Bacteroidia bacterium]|nr:DUF4157 domain-containing protein [Bacteroidia bacterium]
MPEQQSQQHSQSARKPAAAAFGESEGYEGGLYASVSPAGLPDLRPEAERLRGIRQLVQDSPQARQMQEWHDLTNGPGSTNGLPLQLKAGVESLSGMDMGDVQVHYNSAEPARYGALAYAQGSDIHLGPGQEQHLAHEAWHVVQQKQGRVRPTLQMKGADLNDDPALEREADRMGAAASRQGYRALQRRRLDPGKPAPRVAPIARKVIQRAMGFEFETGYVITRGGANLQKLDVVKDYGDGLKMEADVRSTGDSVIEMVLDPPVQENDSKKFGKVLRRFQSVGDEMDGKRQGGAFSFGKYQVTPAFSGFEGSPQITGGVSFSKLFEFLSEVANPDAHKTDPHADAIKDVMSTGNKAQAQSAVTEAGKIQGGDELKGLVAMLVMYLKEGGEGAEMLNYTKLISGSFLMRTDFGMLYNMLPDADRDPFVRDPGSFVTLVLDAAGMSGQDNDKVFKRGIRKSYDKKSPDYTVDISGQVPGLNITRRQWLLQITMGNDLLSAKFASGELKKQLESLGGLGSKLDRVGDETSKQGKDLDPTGVIMEFRNMKKFIHYRDFVPILDRVFKYLAATNSQDA